MDSACSSKEALPRQVSLGGAIGVATSEQRRNRVRYFLAALPPELGPSKASALCLCFDGIAAKINSIDLTEACRIHLTARPRPALATARASPPWNGRRTTSV